MCEVWQALELNGTYTLSNTVLLSDEAANMWIHNTYDTGGEIFVLSHIVA